MLCAKYTQELFFYENKALAVKAIWTLPLDACGGKPADLVFIVDSSSSIWPKHFREHVLTFLHEVIDMLDVGPHEMQTRVGAVTFSDQVYLEFYLKRFMDKEQLLERVKQVDVTLHDSLIVTAKRTVR